MKRLLLCLLLWSLGAAPAWALSADEQRYVVQVIHHWLVLQMNSPGH